MVFGARRGQYKALARGMEGVSRMKLDLLTDVRGRRSSVSAELRGAVATFLTMAYILPTNAGILAGAEGMGAYTDSIVACTALAAGVCCILMGVVANFP